MSLATITRAPLIVPRSPARSRVLAAANELQRAVDQLFEEAKAEAREKAKRDEENDRKAEAHVARARARLATREYRVEVPARWFWSFTADAIDAMRDLAAEARKQGQNGPANALDARIEAACAELERIQKGAAK